MPVAAGQTHTCVLSRRQDSSGSYVDVSLEKARPSPSCVSTRILG